MNEDGEAAGAHGMMGSSRGGKNENGVRGFYARRLSIPRGERKGGGPPEQAAHGTRSCLLHAVEGARLAWL
jgi:hypothetical protein